MGHLSSDADFAAEAFIAGTARQKLERHRLPEQQVVSPVDLTHSAFAEQRNDAVAIDENLPGFKAASVSGRCLRAD